MQWLLRFFRPRVYARFHWLIEHDDEGLLQLHSRANVRLLPSWWDARVATLARTPRWPRC